MTSYRAERTPGESGAALSSHSSLNLSRNSSLSSFAPGSLIPPDLDTIKDTIRELVMDATAEMRNELQSLRTEVKGILLNNFYKEAEEQHKTAIAVLPPCTADQLIIDLGEGSLFETLMHASLERIGGVVLELR